MFEPEVHLVLRLNRSGLLYLASSWVFLLDSALSKPMHSPCRYGDSGTSSAAANTLFSAVASHSFLEVMVLAGIWCK